MRAALGASGSLIRWVAEVEALAARRLVYPDVGALGAGNTVPRQRSALGTHRPRRAAPEAEPLREDEALATGDQDPSRSRATSG